jgi:1,4-dihydroxy-2-naphthoate octaprenyltransferase
VPPLPQETNKTSITNEQNSLSRITTPCSSLPARDSRLPERNPMAVQILERVDEDDGRVYTCRRLKDCWTHLRLPFQLSLSPIFLLGVFLDRPSKNSVILAAFASLHFFLYTGITVYNSYFDRDNSAVGGLERPPPPTNALLPLAIVLKTIGLIVATFVGWVFAAIYFAFILLSVLYSHPRYRWKASPWLSLAVVCGGQGVLGFLAGWAAAHGEIRSAAGEPGILGAVSAAILVLGLYPLTQQYQLAEDDARGDRTIVLALGQQSALRFSQTALVAGCTTSIILAARHLQVVDTILLAAGFIVLMSGLEWLQRNVDGMDSHRLFQFVTRVNYCAAAGFVIFILTRVARWD